MVSQLTQLKKYKVRPNKRLGQNFLVDENVVDEIIDLYDLKKDEVIVEIGAGLGALTTRLAARVKKVLAVEIDKDLVTLLKNSIIKDKNVEVINQDILNLDFLKIAKLYGDKLKVLGNIPYSISVPLLFKLLENKNSLSVAILMFQNEVADRIVANPGTKDYGVLSVFSQISASVSKELLISKDSFYPQPKVDSAVVKFIFSEFFSVGIKDEEIFKTLVRAAFAQRRKTLKNTLKNTLNLDILFDDVLNAMNTCGIDPKRRGETLKLEEFKDLANYLTKLKPH
ncbi:MAG: 16S rRNA (adenine(1518)-N(6)/adenine(1519)-N(6))-dimethyltransferase RsmA [Pseudomonadota bacterium]